MTDRRGTLALFALLALGACGTSRAPRIAGVPEPGGFEDMSCVPYARARSGLTLRGDAWQWWDAAAGRYARTRRPQPGAVLVIGRTSRLPQGHVAVVARVVGPREIRVDHANWAAGAAKGRVARDQPVLDVSPGNDWSLVRVWYPRIGDYGATAFAAHGFVGPRLAFAGG